MRYGGVAILLHWLTAAAVVALLAMGLAMTRLPPGLRQFQLYQWHKSLGIAVLALSLLRLGWRLAHRPPAFPDSMPAWEKRAAHLAHWAFYALLLGLPISGWAVVSASPLNIPTVLFGVLPWPHLPVLSSLPDKAPVEAALARLHDAGSWGLLALLGVHVAAALRHHLLLHDDILRRMLPIVALVLVLCRAPGALAAEWVVDLDHSRLGFSGSQVDQPFDGRFTRFEAAIDFDPANPAAGHAVVSIDMASATTGDRQKDEALPQSDWFAVRDFPQARFEATGFRAKGGNAYEAVGTLTIRGIAQQVVLPFSLDLLGDSAHARGRLDLLRTTFGVGQGAWSNGQWVALEVTVTVDLVAVRK